MTNGIVAVKHNTPFEYKSGDTVVFLKRVGCTGVVADGQENNCNEVDLAVHFTVAEGKTHLTYDAQADFIISCAKIPPKS